MSLEREDGLTPEESEAMIRGLLPDVPREHWEVAVDRVVLNIGHNMWASMRASSASNSRLRNTSEEELTRLRGEIAKWEEEHGHLGLKIPNARLSLLDPETGNEQPFP